MLSLLIKPLGLLIIPLYLYYYLTFIIRRYKKNKGEYLSRLIINHLLLMLLFLLIHLPFDMDLRFGWILDLYKYHIREFLGYSTANAFNLWGLVLGFNPVRDSTSFLNIPYLAWGIGFYFLGVLFILKYLTRTPSQSKIIMALCLTAFSAFLFLTRMHERYMFLILLLLAPISGLTNKLKRLSVFISIAFFLNLYHYWWVPKIDFLMTLMSNHLVEKILILFNFYLLYNMYKVYVAMDKSK